MIQSLEIVVSLQPNSVLACNTLAIFYLERDYQLDEAFALAKRAVYEVYAYITQFTISDEKIFSNHKWEFGSLNAVTRKPTAAELS